MRIRGENELLKGLDCVESNQDWNSKIINMLE